MRRSAGVVFAWLFLLSLQAPCLGATLEDVVKKIQGLSPGPRKAALEEGARKEGEIVWYTSMSFTDYPKIVSAFEQAHPFLKVRANRLSQSTVFTKVDTEARAGHMMVDLIGSAPTEIWELKQKGYSAPYVSPELKAFPVGSYDPQGYWSSFEVTPIVVAFNTKLVPSDEMPRNYQELLQPKWKGKINLGSDEYAWFSVMLDGMGKTKGLEYMKALARQQLNIPGSSSIMRLQLMMAGESAIALAARGRRVVEYKEKGAPLDYRLFDPYPAEPNALVLMRRTVHPHAAILFIDWILSEEGQSVLAQQVPRLTLRKGVKQIPRHQELYRKDFVFVNPASIGPNLNELIASYQQIFNVR
ncbi:MAG TPA: extracellular solute-binding protein [Candidatus Acidoferrales bacterium]|nr:extracellular solute-binding protein [Candidatus Acidoferrales bacterium]